MALPFTSSKRPFERHPNEPNGRGKWQKTSPSISQPSQFKVPPGSVVFRVLCPSSKSGSVIGKKGGVVAKIRNETGARIKLEDIVSGCDERVVTISGPAKDSDFRNVQNKLDDSYSNVDGGEDGKTTAEDGKEKEDSSIAEDSKSMKATSSVQKALLLIFERIIEGDQENDDADEANKKLPPSIRLLVFSNQVGCLLGKGGSVIKQTSSDSGAHIRILPRKNLPLCALPHDEIVQISGSVDSIRKALQSVSQQLMENPPGSSSHPYATNPRPEPFNKTNYHMPVQEPPFPNRAPFDAPDISSFPKFHEGPVPGQMPVSAEVLIFRLLCSNDKVGSVIGKGGNVVRNLQHETGCEIKVLETAAETENRIIVIYGPSLPGDRISPSQDALLRVLHRICMPSSESKDNNISVMARLLVAPNQTACLLGKGGSIIAEMRKLSGANIRVLSKDKVPMGVSENEEIVQVSGEFGFVQEALLQITARLRGHLFRDKTSGLNHSSHPAFLDQRPPFGSYLGREPSPPRLYGGLPSYLGREPSPPRLYGGLPPFQKDAGARVHEDRSAFAHRIHGSGVSPLGAERVPPAPWTPQIVGRVDSMRKALQSVSQQLMENPPRDCDFPADIPPGSSSHPYASNPRPEPFNTTDYQMSVQGPPFPNRSRFDAADVSSFSKFHEGPVSGQMSDAPEVLIFRLLCSKNKVGSVIGKGGNIVKNLQHETGCEIKVLETAAETEYRIITISGPAVPGDRISPSQDALLRILVAASESKDNTVMARLLVAPNQTGCLLGKGGSIIEEMRKLSGAHIRVFGNDLVPKDLSENDEIVQVSGEYGAVRAAILQITSRLRGHLFHNKTSAFLHNKTNPSGSYMRREPSPPPSLYLAAPPHQDRSAFAHPIHVSPCFSNLNVKWH